MRKKPELLIPAGSPEVLKAALDYGADAVYLAAQNFGLRAGARNFSFEELEDGIRLAHSLHRKIYVTANILAHNEDLAAAESYFSEMRRLSPDALILSDPALFLMAKRLCPEVELHISTQANNTNYGTFQFWHDLGAKRVVAARELSLKEIREIRLMIPSDMEIEAFVHGAMCISYSGRCLLSSFLTGRDANRGACAHPCRWKYTLMEEKRPGEYFPVEEDDRGTYILNSRDLCMVGHIPEMISAGIDSFKVEGRMKTALYAAVTARAYRAAIDDHFNDPERYKARIPEYVQELKRTTYREFTTGFFFGKPGTDAQIYDSNTYHRGSIFLGQVERTDSEGYACFPQKNKFSVGDTVEILRKYKPENEAGNHDDPGNSGTPGKPDTPAPDSLCTIRARVLTILGEDGTERESAPHPLEPLRVRFDAAVEPGEIIRAAEAPAEPAPAQEKTAQSKTAQNREEVSP